MRPATLIKRIVKALVLALALFYIGDVLVFYIHSRHPSSTQPVETFTVARILAIDEKGGKVEYAVDQVQREQTITCAHSVFSHAGFSPCWYAKKKAAQPVPMSILVRISNKWRFSIP